MPAYDRFWDLQISSGGHYDWKEEIVQNCIYQRETKRTNNVKGKALITLPNLSNSEITVAACLRRLVNVAVTVDFSGSTQAAVMMGTLVAAMGEHLDVKTLVLDASVSATSKRTLKVYAKEFSTLDTAPADNRAYQLSQAGTAYTFQKLPVAAESDIVLIDESARPSVGVLATDPKIGYVSTTVNMGDIAEGRVQDYGSDMVTWILGGGKAKIRITCHGDGEGYFEMKDRGSTLRSVRADAVAAWLVANGLRHKGNLETINVNICMGAKGNITPAVLKAGVYTAADASAVSLIARVLGDAGVHGVRVTGANEVVAGIEQKELEGPSALTAVSGGPLLAGQGVRKIQIPAGFGFDAATLTITVPAGWSDM